MILFYSYCHADETALGRIQKGLRILIENERVEEWWDRKLRGSDNLSGEIGTALENADVIMMLLSDAYLASESCRKEMDYAIKENGKRNKIAVPVVIRECGWEEVEELRNIVALPRDAKPLVRWPSVDSGIADIRKSMKSVFEKARGHRESEERYGRFLKRIKEIEFISQKKRDVELNDVFVFPNVTTEMEDGSQSIGTFTDFWNSGRRLLLIGEQRSGKTTLCNKIALDLAEKGEGVLLVQEAGQVDNKGAQWIKELCRDQVLGGHRKWREFTRKTLIFDNAEAVTNFGFSFECRTWSLIGS